MRNRCLVLTVVGALLHVTVAIAASAQTPLFPAKVPATPVSPPAPQTYPNLSIPKLEQEIFEQVNQHRAQRGLLPLKLDPKLSEQARIHSLDMAEKRLPFSHVDFDKRVRRIGRVVPGRRMRISENLAYIFSHNEPAKRAVNGWLQSDRHRAILEGNYALTGVGVAIGYKGALYFTQVYVQPQ